MAINLRLYHVQEIDISYQNAPYFENFDNQLTWFNNKWVRDIETNMVIEPSRTSASIDMGYHELQQLGVNYVSAPDKSGKTMFYFIMDFEYRTRNATTLILQLDVLQTFMFDFTFRETFVDRMHVDRYVKNGLGGYNPAGGTVEEGLGMGDMTYHWEKKKDFPDRYVITSTSPLGWSEAGSPPEPTPTPTEDCWKSGKLSSKGFRFIKGFEAFAPWKYQDSSGYWTIAYGVTKHGEKDVYDKLLAKQPVLEKEGAMISYSLKNERYAQKIINVCRELGISKQYQFDALVSFSYNLGIGVINDRGSSIYKAIKKNINDVDGITKAFGLYVWSGGKKEQGLIDRRRDEAQMFFGNYPKPRDILKINQKGKYEGTVTDNNGNGWLPSEC